MIFKVFPNDNATSPFILFLSYFAFLIIIENPAINAGTNT